MNSTSAKAQWGKAGGGLSSNLNSQAAADSISRLANATKNNFSSFMDKSPFFTQVPVTEDAADALEAGTTGEAAANPPSSFSWTGWQKQMEGNAPKDSIGWKIRFKGFVGLLLMAGFFFFLAIIFFPLLVIRPSKFALSFTLASCCFMGAFAMLKGPSAYVKGLLEPASLPGTVVYIVSLLATLYGCLILGSYMFVVFSCAFQIAALSWYAARNLPGGGAGLKAFARMMKRTATLLLKGIYKLFSS